MDEVFDSFFLRLSEHAGDLSHRLADGVRALFDPPPKNGHNGHKKRQPPPRRPGAPPPPRPELPLEDPWSILGFTKGAKITKADVKARQKALAKLFHPDLGGSTESMKRVNAAAKRILEEIG